MSLSSRQRVVLAPDKFKGTLTSAQAAAALKSGLTRNPEIDVVHVPVADGGDGTLAVALSAGYRPMQVAAADAMGNPRSALIAVSGTTAIIELASICGLQTLAPNTRDPEACSTLGLGMAMRAALDAGFTQLSIGLGGSASTDGGAGMLQGLGAVLLNRSLEAVHPGAARLSETERIDLAPMLSTIDHARIRFLTDVSSPLLGEAGTAKVFGPQKGADDATISRLEEGLESWVQTVRGAFPHANPELPGSGAAGGVGFAGAALGGALVSGAEALLDLVDFDECVKEASLVITGEGKLDRGTLMGKAPLVVAKRAKRAGVDCLAVVGSRGTDLEAIDLRTFGWREVHELSRMFASAHTPQGATVALEQVGELIAKDLHHRANPALTLE